MTRGFVAVLATAAALVLVIALVSRSQQPSELFDAENPDVFQADSVYSASPARDQSARVMYSTPEEEQGQELFAHSRSPQPKESLDAGASLALFGGVNDLDKEDMANALSNDGAAAQMLAVMPNRRGVTTKSTYRGSLAGLNRLRKQQRRAEEDAQQFPTPYQRRLREREHRAQLAELQKITGPVEREANDIRRRWIQAEQQQREDRAVYDHNRKVVSEPGRPFNIAHPRQAYQRQLDDMRKEREERRWQQQALAQTQPKGGDAAFAALAEQDTSVVKAAPAAHTASSPHPAPAQRVVSSAARTTVQQHAPMTAAIKRRPRAAAAPVVIKARKPVVNAAHDASHSAALDIIDSAFTEHSELDVKDSEVRHNAAERLHRKAEKLRELDEQQREQQENDAEKADTDKRQEAEDRQEAKQLQERAGQLLQDAHSQRHHDDSVLSFSDSPDSDPAADAEHALVRDQKKQRMDELKLANEAVRGESLTAHHKDISVALQAKMDSLRARIAKDARAVATDRAALENIASPDERNHHSSSSLDMSPTTTHGAVYDDTEKAKRLIRKAQLLRAHAHFLKAKVSNAKYSKQTLGLAAKCLESQADKLEDNASGHSQSAQQLYNAALKTCGLL